MRVNMIFLAVFGLLTITASAQEMTYTSGNNTYKIDWSGGGAELTFVDRQEDNDDRPLPVKLTKYIHPVLGTVEYTATIWNADAGRDETFTFVRDLFGNLTLKFSADGKTVTESLTLA